MTVNRSIHVLDKNGKKLFSVETNMRGIPRLAEWIESTDLAATLTPAMERQTEHQVKEEQAIQWREEYHTHWHDHLNAIRRGLWAVVILYLAGVFLPIPLYVFADVKLRAVMAVAALSPVPFLIFCIVFAPVLIFGDRPKMRQKNGIPCISDSLCPFCFYRLLQCSGRFIIYGAEVPCSRKAAVGYGSFRGVLIAVPVIFCAFPAHHRGKRLEAGVL